MNTSVSSDTSFANISNEDPILYLWNKPFLVWCIILIAGFNFLILVWGILNPCLCGILVCNFLYSWHFCLVLVSGNSLLIKFFRGYSILLYSGIVWNYWNYFYFKYLVEFDSGAIWTWSYLWWKVLNYKLNFFNSYKIIQVICILLSKLWSI